jgi:cytochrome c-type biogenesis protein CcmH/NrfF
MRYFDGDAWTQHTGEMQPLPTPLMDDAERADRLMMAVAQSVRYGARVESQTQFQAVLVYGHNVDYVAHLIGVFLTCGLWLIPMFIVMATQKTEQRVSARVDPYGNIVTN